MSPDAREDCPCKAGIIGSGLPAHEVGESTGRCLKERDIWMFADPYLAGFR